MLWSISLGIIRVDYRDGTPNPGRQGPPESLCLIPRVTKGCKVLVQPEVPGVVQGFALQKSLTASIRSTTGMKRQELDISAINPVDGGQRDCEATNMLMLNLMRSGSHQP